MAKSEHKMATKALVLSVRPHLEALGWTFVAQKMALLRMEKEVSSDTTLSLAFSAPLQSSLMESDQYAGINCWGGVLYRSIESFIDDTLEVVNRSTESASFALTGTVPSNRLYLGAYLVRLGDSAETRRLFSDMESYFLPRLNEASEEQVLKRDDYSPYPTPVSWSWLMRRAAYARLRCDQVTVGKLYSVWSKAAREYVEGACPSPANKMFWSPAEARQAADLAAARLLLEFLRRSLR